VKKFQLSGFEFPGSHVPSKSCHPERSEGPAFRGRFGNSLRAGRIISTDATNAWTNDDKFKENEQPALP